MHKFFYGCMLLYCIVPLRHLQADTATISSNFLKNSESRVTAEGQISGIRSLEGIGNTSDRNLGRFLFLKRLEVNHLWKKIDVENQISDQFSSLVLTSPPSFHGPQPGVVRIRPVEECCAQPIINQSASPQPFISDFEARFQEYTYLDHIHNIEQLSLLGARPGVHSSETNISGNVTKEVIAIDSFEISGTGQWSQINFSVMPGIPRVFLSAQTARGFQPISLRVRNVTNNSFEVAMQEEESLMLTGHVVEKIAYLLIYNTKQEGFFTIGEQQIPYQVRQIMINHKWTPILGVELKLEEESSADNELFHVKENVDVLRLGNHIFAQQVSDHGKDTSSLRLR